MADATYPVLCECGATHQVRGAQAGTTIDCRCGRTVRVPSLTKLKKAAGEAALSADLELAVLCDSGALPPETDCVCCGMPTDKTAWYWVRCERAEVDTGEMPFWQKAFLVFTFGWLLAMVITQSHTPRATVRGRDVQFRLPVRVCPDCLRTLTSREAVREAMCRTPVYARLFEKYPHSWITNAD